MLILYTNGDLYVYVHIVLGIICNYKPANASLYSVPHRLPYCLPLGQCPHSRFTALVQRIKNCFICKTQVSKKKKKKQKTEIKTKTKPETVAVCPYCGAIALAPMTSLTGIYCSICVEYVHCHVLGFDALTSLRFQLTLTIDTVPETLIGK